MFNLKLGRKAVIHDSRTLKLAKYLQAATAPLPPPPAEVNWLQGKTNWGMMVNDKLGDCTIAGCGHAIQVWSANVGTEVTIPDSDIIATYEAWDGYDPKDPSTDCGGIELNVLNAWQKNGFAGHVLKAYTSVNFKNNTEVKQAINLFGGVYIGVSLPNTASNQTIWDVVPNGGDDAIAGSWGGHCVFVAAYDPEYVTCITWGAPLKMTWTFWNTYVDESYALLGHNWMNNAGVNPQNISEDLLMADLHQIR